MDTADTTKDKITESSTDEFLIEQIEAERNRNVSLEQRGVGVIAATGTMITLLLALSGLTAKGSSLSIPSSALLQLRRALILLVSAALLSIVANLPRISIRRFSDRHGSTQSFVKGLKENLIRAYSEQELRSFRLRQLRDIRIVNTTKGWLLAIALVFQAVGILLLAITVYSILSTSGKA